MNLASTSYHTIYQNINSKWIKNLHVKAKTIELLEENLDVHLCRFGLATVS
jgi:hypothetical protein